MDGVTILNEMSFRGEELWRVVCFVILGIAAISSMVIDNVKYWHYSGLATRIVGIIGTLFVAALLSVFTIAACMSYNTFHTEYKVNIDDSVGFNEFNSRYEIISQDGDIYTVIEKVDE